MKTKAAGDLVSSIVRDDQTFRDNLNAAADDLMKAIVEAMQDWPDDLL